MVVCRLCSQEFPSNWKLNVHLKSSKHQRQTVICPWCPIERTYTRTVDLKNHCEKSHAVETKRLGNGFFSSGNCFYFSIYPEDYAVICNVEEWSSQNAMEARRLLEKWVEWQPGSNVKKEVWRKGWKNGLRLAAEHRGRIQDDKENEGDDYGGETDEEVETESKVATGLDEEVKETDDSKSDGKSENTANVLKQKVENVNVLNVGAGKREDGDVENKMVKIVTVVNKGREDRGKSVKVLKNEKETNKKVENEKVLEINVRKDNAKGDTSEKVDDVVKVKNKSREDRGKSVKVLKNEKMKNEKIENKEVLEVNVKKDKAKSDTSEKVVDIVEMMKKSRDERAISAKEKKCEVVENENVLDENIGEEKVMGNTSRTVVNAGEKMHEKRESVKQNANHSVEIKVQKNENVNQRAEIKQKNKENVLKETVETMKVFEEAADGVIDKEVDYTKLIKGNVAEDATVLVGNENADVMGQGYDKETNRELERAVLSIMPDDTDRDKIEESENVKVPENCVEVVNKRDKERKHKHKKDKREKKAKKSKKVVAEKLALPNGETLDMTKSSSKEEKEILPSVSAKEIDEYIADLTYGLDNVSSGTETPLLDEKPREADLEGELSIVGEVLSREADKEKKGLKRSVGQENRQKKKVKISTEEYRTRKSEDKAKVDGEISIINSKGEYVVLKQNEDMVWHRSKGRVLEGKKIMESVELAEKGQDNIKSKARLAPHTSNRNGEGNETNKILSAQGGLDSDAVSDGTDVHRKIGNLVNSEAVNEGVKTKGAGIDYNKDSAVDGEMHSTGEFDTEQMTYSASAAADSVDVTDSYEERAKYILKRGVMPLCPPAPRQWGTDLSAQVSIPISGTHALVWPPAYWETMTPDRKLMSTESAAMTLESCLFNYVDPTMSRAYLMDKYRYLILPGSSKYHKEVTEEASNKARCYLYHVIREIATGKRPSAAELAQLDIVENVMKSQVLNIDPSLINVPLRLNKEEK